MSIPPDSLARVHQLMKLPSACTAKEHASCSRSPYFSMLCVGSSAPAPLSSHHLTFLKECMS